MSDASEHAFLLTRQWRDTSSGVELVFWASSDRGPIRIVLERQEAVAFAERGRVDAAKLDAWRVRSLELETLSGVPVDGLYFSSRRALVDANRQVRAGGGKLYESDVRPSDRFLMERFVTGGLEVTGSAVDHGSYREFRNPKVSSSDYRPELSVLSLDIETDGGETLYSIAGTMGDAAHVFMLRSPDWISTVEHSREDDIEHSVHADEATLLEEFFAWVSDVDPDVVIGWNVIDFDLHFLETCCERLNLSFALGRGRDRATLLAPSVPGGKRVSRIPGRAVLDGIDTLRTATWSFEDFGLGAVSRELLGRSKLIQTDGDGDGADERADKIGEIQRLYREAPWELMRYNLEDCRLVDAIFEHAGLIDFAVERAQLTGLALDRVGGAVAAFDNLYLPRLHRQGRIAPNVETHDVDDLSPGGFVMDSQPGLFRNVVVLDFKSLYPSIIRTFLVDPLALAEGRGAVSTVPGFEGASFARAPTILPGLVEHMSSARERAKQAGNEAVSRAIKIMMNSLYGVLGTTACRFFDPRLVSSITRRGHEIIGRSREFIEAAGHPVIYGDTDSLFVHLADEASERQSREIGSRLARELTEFWERELRERFDLPSYLELEFEKHYVRFFMPTIRGSELGSKKRYAGLVRAEDASGTLELQFTGLESVRSDWTPLARAFQREIYRRVFHDEPYEDYVKETADALYDGAVDEQLVYRKRLRRRIQDYVKNVPPHAQAARKSHRSGRWVRYVITKNGPEPMDNNPSRLDYDHYLDRQLAPAADALLQALGTSVKKILDTQLSLF